MPGPVQTMGGFCLFVDTLCDGWVPIERDEAGKPIVYLTRLEAERVIAENTIDHLQEFLAGEREFDDAMNPEDCILEVTVFADGSIEDSSGNWFGKSGERRAGPGG